VICRVGGGGANAGGGAGETCFAASGFGRLASGGVGSHNGCSAEVPALGASSLSPPPSPRNRIIAWTIKILIVAVVVWFVRGTLTNAWSQLQAYQWTLRPGWLIASGLLYLGGMLLAGVFWRQVLLALGEQAGLVETLRAYYIGHLGKYVPGKAMVFVIRAGLLAHRRVNPAVAAVAVFVETMTMMAVGAAVGGVIVAVGFYQQKMLFLGSLAMVVLAGLPTLPPVFRLAVRILGIGRSNPQMQQGLLGLGYRTLLLGWVINVPAWLLIGLSLWATLRGIGIELELHASLLPCVACSTLGTVVGILSMLPGGIGAREAALLWTMAQLLQLPAAQATIAAGMLRLITVVAELAISAVLYPLEVREPHEDPAELGDVAPLETKA
jgi:uncharacterized membrane protein YbhN (UPF0104 family)